jgi:diacylglycerol kinase family enzyme
MQTMIVVYNPAAGSRRAHVLWRVIDILRAKGISIELLETGCSGHATTLAREAVAAGASMVVAAGGDGTINEVTSGLVGSQAKLGVIPLATANVLAHEYDLPFAPEVIAATLAFGRTRLLWPGMAQARGGSRLFVQMLSVGFDAQVVHRLPSGLKRRFGRAAYILQVLQELPRYRFVPIKLCLDRQPTEAITAIISKGRLYGGRYTLSPMASSTEPGFSVVLFDQPGIVSAIRYGASLPLGLLSGVEGVRHIRARHIEFVNNDGLLAQADGDPAVWTPITVTDAPAAIKLVSAQPTRI